MKVVFLGKYNVTEYLTGPEKVAKRIFSEYTKSESSVFIEYFFDGRKYGLIKKLFGNEIVLKQGNSTVLRLGVIKVLLYFLKQKPDIIHIITFERFAITAFLYKIFCKVKIVYNIHGVVIHENTKYNKVNRFYYMKDKACEKYFLKYSDRLIFLSEESLKIASSFFVFDKYKAVIFPNGIDEVFHSKGRNNHQTVSDKLRIAFTGNTSRKEKGFEFLKETLFKSGINFELYLAGNKWSSGLKNFTNVPLMDTSAFSDFLSDKHIFISASEYEPFSISAAEAMAAGLVPVVTRQTGMSRYIIDGENGFVFDYGDSKKLIEILSGIIINTEGFSLCRSRAKEIYHELNWQKVFNLYLTIYNSK